MMKCLCYTIRMSLQFLTLKILLKGTALVSEEEIVKARPLVTEQELRAQETLIFCKSFIENIDNASLARLQNSALNQCFETPKFNVKNSEKKRYQKVP